MGVFTMSNDEKYLSDLYRQNVEEGIADAEAGNLVDLDAVKDKWSCRSEARKAAEEESHDS